MKKLIVLGAGTAGTMVAALLPGRPLPVSNRMSMRGKRPLKTSQTAA